MKYKLSSLLFSIGLLAASTACVAQAQNTTPSSSYLDAMNKKPSLVELSQCLHALIYHVKYDIFFFSRGYTEPNRLGISFVVSPEQLEKDRNSLSDYVEEYKSDLIDSDIKYADDTIKAADEKLDAYGR